MKTVVIAGNVGKPAEVRNTQSGQKVTGWSVAVTDGWGENKRTIWFDCSWWGQRGEKVADYIKKGEKITVSGELSTREHDGKTYLTVNVSDVTLQGGGSDSGGGQSGGYGQQGGGSGGSGYGAGGRPGDDEFDEIPFAPEFR